jgi:hypothetical protein
MECFANLIYKSHMTYIPTNLPVQFYGLPDGKVYLIYARFYDIKFGKSGIEYVIAEHEEFSYDYECGKLIPLELNTRQLPVYVEMVDKPDPKIKILKVDRTLNSYAEAYTRLNKKALQILKNINKETIQLINNKIRLNQSVTI